ncbi:hypothetical protein [uncultured Microbacterium sp.]|uniref:DsrE family protein n=1 Tax=uncultured Microbacterium sp. TaxID=191216 RepID=UPI0037494196
MTLTAIAVIAASILAGCAAAPLSDEEHAMLPLSHVHGIREDPSSDGFLLGTHEGIFTITSGGELVVQGGAVRGLVADGDHRDVLVTAIPDSDVRVLACQNSMNREGIDAASLLDKVWTVPAAVGYLARTVGRRSLRATVIPPSPPASALSDGS